MGGVKPLIPKDDGQGVMISSFCCCELGYGFQPPKEEIDAVNKTHETQQYIDVDAAPKKYGKSSKKIETSPFVCELE